LNDQLVEQHLLQKGTCLAFGSQPAAWHVIWRTLRQDAQDMRVLAELRGAWPVFASPGGGRQFVRHAAWERRSGVFKKRLFLQATCRFSDHRERQVGPFGYVKQRVRPIGQVQDPEQCHRLVGAARVPTDG
jgi:hypothetical protein